jgi:hypothetical protein
MAALAAAALGLAAVLGGCARGEPVGPPVPQAVLDILIRFQGPVDDSSYYFFAINANNDWGASYPVPVAAGPYWGNGWGTGTITHFLEYHLGTYEFYQATLVPILRSAGGGISAVGGVPTGGAAGRYFLTIQSIALGAAAAPGSHGITAVTNNSDQNAGSLVLQTNAAGQVVGGSVSFTPAAHGGRPLNSSEQAALNALNAGGVALAANSLSALGLTLTLGPATVETVTLTVAPATATVEARFVPIAAGSARVASTTLTADSVTPTATPPIPGATLTTGDLTVGGQATVDAQMSQTPVLIGPPFAWTLPYGSNALQATLDLSLLGPGVTNISFNIISTTDLIFDPTITDPKLHCYDGLGPLGNDAITIPITEYTTYSNATAAVHEGPNDSTLAGTVSPARRNSVDIIDWIVTVRRLR